MGVFPLRRAGRRDRRFAAEGAAVFHRGVSHYPPLGEEVTTVTPADLQTVYARPSVPNVRIGRLGNNELQPAFVMTDELLAQALCHFGLHRLRQIVLRCGDPFGTACARNPTRM